jgi:phage repressor protein C with HTH and peptisase S24 domain
LGVFEKAPNNPVLQKNVDQGGKVTGTGHNMVLTLPDGEMLCVYHGRTQETGDKRVVFIDKMEIDGKGQLIVHGQATKQ